MVCKGGWQEPLATTAGLKNLEFSGQLNILLRTNICGGLKVLCSEIPNFLNPKTVELLNSREMKVYSYGTENKRK